MVFFSRDIAQTVPAVIAAVKPRRDSLLDLRVERPSLEDRFLELTDLISRHAPGGATMNAFIHPFRLRIPHRHPQRSLLLMNYLFPLGFYLMMGFDHARHQSRFSARR